MIAIANDDCFVVKNESWPREKEAEAKLSSGTCPAKASLNSCYTLIGCTENSREQENFGKCTLKDS